MGERFVRPRREEDFIKEEEETKDDESGTENMLVSQLGESPVCRVLRFIEEQKRETLKINWKNSHVSLH